MHGSMESSTRSRPGSVQAKTVNALSASVAYPERRAWGAMVGAPVVGPTDLPWNLEGKHVVIIDDVLYTGRTVRAALDELADFGRPARIALAVLVDRGGRELPIHADIVGKKIEVSPTDRVDVLVDELDGKDAVVVVPRDEGA